MKTSSELCTQTLPEIAALIKQKKVSPVELTQAMLDRIEGLDQKLHSYITVTSGLAMQQARAAEQEISIGTYRGPLHGVPIAVKDLICTKDIRTTCGSKILANWLPKYDATVVEKLNAAGAVLLGKLSMTEFAGIGYHSSVQAPVNPWNPERWPGASSSGPGVATAASLCLGSLGSDTGGSIRFPSAACGIVGVKPTYGTVSRYGIFPLAESLDHVGPMARCVTDAALILGVIAGFDSRDPTSRRESVPDYLGTLHKPIKGLRIAVDEAPCAAAVDPDVRKAVLDAANVLNGLGARLHEVKLSGLEEAPTIWGTIFSAECAAAHEQTYLSRPNDYGSTFRQFIEDGLKVRGLDYAKAWVRRQKVCQMIDDLFEQVDLLLWPTMGAAALPLEEFSADGNLLPERALNLLRLTAPFSLTGNPVISLPCGFNREGLPLSIQIIGRRGEESTVMQTGYAYEQATEWHKQRPPYEE